MIKIEAKEYFELYEKEKENLSVYSSFTDTTGNGHLWSDGTPQWMTEWGFKDRDQSFIKAISETIDGVTNHKYYKYELAQ